MGILSVSVLDMVGRWNDPLKYLSHAAAGNCKHQAKSTQKNGEKSFNVSFTSYGTVSIHNGLKHVWKCAQIFSDCSFNKLLHLP